ncbi:hypothetical protein QBC38DRAFT_127648 [Podospora fimiseda]|uniref:Uncharacterized protein n=1 Tax=Podospora fimiseda TaxID=252190 RepID=A0AAN7BSU1_9PEZI|nr:hypothetical protein QBC38DRAFT_127648 [Podospora fimiseda]
MMLSESQNRRAISCAEKLALLSLLKRAPSTPKKNEPPPQTSEEWDPERVLSFSCEICLSETLAFLCGVSDSHAHVVAVSIEEPMDSSGIDVVVAINRNLPDSNSDIISQITDGLSEIFAHLSQVKVNDEEALSNEEVLLEDRVLVAILEMCKPRLLSRIRSKQHHETYERRINDRPFFGSSIMTTVEAVRKYRKVKRKSTELRDQVAAFLRDATYLANALCVFEMDQSVGFSIKDITKLAAHLTAEFNLDIIFDGIAPNELAPQEKARFIDCVKKLARYYEASQFLFQLSKKSGLFKNATVTTVSLDAQYFSRVKEVPVEGSLAKCLNRCQGPSWLPPFGVNGISRRLKKDKPESNVAFREALNTALCDSKIHAEMQIVAYYELPENRNRRRPRVICASKDACYPCNEFVQLHQVFYIPRTHGNLYKGWRVPAVPSLSPVHDQLNKSLLETIGNILYEFHEDHRKTADLKSNENESSICNVKLLMSSLDGIKAAASNEQQSVTGESSTEPGQAPAVLHLTGSTVSRTNRAKHR